MWRPTTFLPRGAPTVRQTCLALTLAVGLPTCHTRRPPPRPPAAPAATIVRLDGSQLSTAEVDRVVPALMASAQVVGFSLAVINQDRLVHARAYGWADAPTRTPLGETTLMYAASFTKAAFAYLVLQLVGEGLIDLDRPVERSLGAALGTFERYRDLAGEPRTALLTPRMLLAHTSGLPNHRSLTSDGKLALFFAPGSRYAYSGEGINLLQLVVEKVAGQPLNHLMQQRVFQRFDMRRSRMVYGDKPAGDVAEGHDRQGRPVKLDRPSSARAASSLDTTAAEYGAFLTGVLAGAGLTPAAHREMLRPQIAITSRRQFPTLAPETTEENRGIALSYGLGWGLFRGRHGDAFFKEGHDDGWENHAVCFSQQRSCLVMMSNSANGERLFIPLLKLILGDHDTPARWEGYPTGDE